MSKADEYFIHNLHLMFNKTTLRHLNDHEAYSIKAAYQQKSLIETKRLHEKEMNEKNENAKEKPDLPSYSIKEMEENEENARIDYMLEMLEKLFRNFAGGGMSIEKLKDTLREKIKAIKPRY